MNKRCSACKTIKSISEFTKNRARKDGFSYWCKACTKEHREKPEPKRRMKKYHEQYDLEYSKKPERRLAQEKNRLKYKYGMTREDKLIMFDEQRGLCAICFNAFKDLKSSCVDHDHDTGKVRKLLCKPCNSFLGMIDEDRNTAIRLLDYIDSHKQ